MRFVTVVLFLSKVFFVFYVVFLLVFRKCSFLWTGGILSDRFQIGGKWQGIENGNGDLAVFAVIKRMRIFLKRKS